MRSGDTDAQPARLCRFPKQNLCRRLVAHAQVEQVRLAVGSRYGCHEVLTRRAPPHRLRSATGSQTEKWCDDGVVCVGATPLARRCQLRPVSHGQKPHTCGASVLQAAPQVQDVKDGHAARGQCAREQGALCDDGA